MGTFSARPAQGGASSLARLSSTPLLLNKSLIGEILRETIFHRGENVISSILLFLLDAVSVTSDERNNGFVTAFTVVKSGMSAGGITNLSNWSAYHRLNDLAFSMSQSSSITPLTNQNQNYIVVQHCTQISGTDALRFSELSKITFSKLFIR